MNDLIIIGAGGFGREVKWLIDNINQKAPEWNFLGYVDDAPKPINKIENELVLGNIDYLNKIQKRTALALAIGNPAVKRKILEKINNPNIYFPALIHPSALVGNNVVIKDGAIICAQNILTCDILIEEFVTLNLSCTVGHDTSIGKLCSIMPTVNISGEVTIMNEVYIGTGAKIINQINIAEKAIIGAGSVVIKHVSKGTTVVGVPAKEKQKSS